MEMENSKEGLGFNGVREHRLLGLLLLPISSQCGLEAFRAIGCLKFNPDSPQKQAPFFMLSEAHMFWWLYRSPQKVESPSWPIVLWLQGGPGGSGIGVGNFLEFGPLDANLKPRNFTWLQEADLLFVDNPIRTGFSYVEDESLVVKTDDEAATDLTTLLKVLSEKNESFQTSPVYLVAKFYGGKYVVTLAVSILKAIQNKELKLTLGGVALGDSWISSKDFVVWRLCSWKESLGIQSPTLNIFPSQPILAEPTAKVARCTKIINQNSEDAKYVINVKQIAKFVVGLGDKVSPTDIEEGMRVGVDRNKYQIQIPLPPKINPSVTMMTVEEKPDVTYNDVGGCKEQIKKMREKLRRLRT